MARVLADTNVLFPFSLMDLMLALSQDRIHTLLWSEHLLDEWERVIVREQRRSPQAAAAIAAPMWALYCLANLLRHIIPAQRF
jgi:hypothetical protein